MKVPLAFHAPVFSPQHFLWPGSLFRYTIPGNVSGEFCDKFDLCFNYSLAVFILFRSLTEALPASRTPLPSRDGGYGPAMRSRYYLLIGFHRRSSTL